MPDAPAAAATDRSSDATSAYAAASVHSASPARLRLLLINRGVELAQWIANDWEQNPRPGSNEQTLKLLEIFAELLSGITGGNTDAETKLCGQVADLYVFMMQHLTAAESTADVAAIRQIAEVLAVEQETWTQVCAATPENAPVATGGAGLNFTA